MMPSLLVAASWAGVLALDITAFGPWMLSQPMVCGPLYGWLLGNVALGIIIGGIIQLLWMDVTPVGVGIPYDAMATTLLAVYWSTHGPNTEMPYIILTLIVAVPFGWLFRAMDHTTRRVNTWVARRIESVPDEYLLPALAASIPAGVVWSWLRYSVFYAICMVLGGRLLALMMKSAQTARLLPALTLAAILLPVAGLGVVLELFLLEEPENRIRHGKGKA